MIPLWRASTNPVARQRRAAPAVPVETVAAQIAAKTATANQVRIVRR
jgi:hypothetical protein